MTSKREDNDEIRRILAYVYLVKHKAVSFSASSTFSDYQCHAPFNLIQQWPRLQLAGRRDIRHDPDSDSNAHRSEDKTESQGSTMQQKQGNSLWSTQFLCTSAAIYCQALHVCTPRDRSKGTCTYKL